MVCLNARALRQGQTSVVTACDELQGANVPLPFESQLKTHIQGVEGVEGLTEVSGISEVSETLPQAARLRVPWGRVGQS